LRAIIPVSEPEKNAESTKSIASAAHSTRGSEPSKDDFH
jgi:hypothetical protein